MQELACSDVTGNAYPAGCIACNSVMETVGSILQFSHHVLDKESLLLCMTLFVTRTGRGNSKSLPHGALFPKIHSFLAVHDGHH